jgi:Fe-S-cluster containining protein
MLESLDAYRLGQFLQKQGGDIESIEDVYAKYAHPAMLTDGYPVFTLNTCGEDQSCVFLKGNRCTVYDARPRVCRLYPFTVDCGDRGKRFAFYQCLDQNAAHFKGGTVLVKDWMYQNFPKEAQTLFEKEAALLPKLGRLLKELGPDQRESCLFHILFYRYYNFELDQPFPEQYDRNQDALLRELRRRLGKEDGDVCP